MSNTLVDRELTIDFPVSSLYSLPLFSCCFLSTGLTQRKAQTQKAREFHKKSIKEKAVHLSALFSGEACSPHQVTMLMRVSAFLI